MTDLQDPKIIWAKGFLFLALGLVASILVVLESPSLKIVLLLGIAVWAHCRFYYFMFYVIEHYIDSGYRFSGVLSFVRYALRRGPKRPSR